MVNIPALNKSVDCLKKANYDIKTNIIDINFSINIGLDLNLFAIDNAELIYQGVISKDAAFKVKLHTRMFKKDYVFVY